MGRENWRGPLFRQGCEEHGLTVCDYARRLGDVEHQTG